MIRLDQPWLLLLLVLPILMAWWLWRRRKRRPRMKYSSTEVFARTGTTLRAYLLGLPTVLIFLSLVPLIVALTHPQNLWRQQNRLTEGIDIMLVIDVSESMRSDDLTPNRLEKAKAVIKDFIADRTEDQIGVVIFGKETFSLCPLTHDYRAVETFVDRIDFDLVDGDGTAIGMGLANAVNRLRQSKATSKVAILLTDGVNNVGRIDPLSAAEIAKQFDVRVYTIGVGGDGKKSVRTPFGFRRGIRARAQLDEEQLTQIAKMTGGQYFRATDDKSLEGIYKQIDAMERTKFEVEDTAHYDELAHWLMIPGLILLLLGFALESTWLRTFP